MLASRCCSCFGDLLIGGAVAALYLHIDLRWYSEVEDLRHQIGWLEIEQHIGKGGRQLAA
jgi:hypothetical protein